MDPETGRAAVLFPHGVLFRQEEKALRENLVKSGTLECVLGLGAGLFYNSPMEAVVVILRANRPVEQRDKVLFINAVELVSRERAQSFLRPAHQETILSAYENFADVTELAKVVSTERIAKNNYSLAIPLYVAGAQVLASTVSLQDASTNWREAATVSESVTAQLLASLGNGVAT